MTVSPTTRRQRSPFTPGRAAAAPRRTLRCRSVASSSRLVKTLQEKKRPAVLRRLYLFLFASPVLTAFSCRAAILMPQCRLQTQCRPHASVTNEEWKHGFACACLRENCLCTCLCLGLLHMFKRELLSTAVGGAAPQHGLQPAFDEGIVALPAPARPFPVRPP